MTSMYSKLLKKKKSPCCSITASSILLSPLADPDADDISNKMKFVTRPNLCRGEHGCVELG